MTGFSLTRIFSAAAIVGAAHFAMTGLESGVASGFIALYAGWGALAYDILQAVMPRTSGKGDGQKNSDQVHTPV